MRRLATRVNLAGFVILLFLAATGFNTWQRFDWGGMAVVVRNLTSDVQLIRVIDGTSGRDAGTFAVEGARVMLLVDERLDVWYRDLTASEQALGRSNDFIVELLGPDRCELIDRQRVDHRDPRIDVNAGGFFSYMDGAEPTPTIASRVADPCAGRPATPRGLIANQTSDRVVVGQGLVLEPCTSRIIHAGDIASRGDPFISEGAIRVRVPSLDAQDERWPLEPRTVVVSAEHVLDESYGGFGPDELASCGGHVPTRFVVDD